MQKKHLNHLEHIGEIKPHHDEDHYEEDVRNCKYNLQYVNN